MAAASCASGCCRCSNAADVIIDFDRRLGGYIVDERTVMRIESVELRRIRPAAGHARSGRRSGCSMIARCCSSGSATATAEGWGECVAMSDPLYSSEYVDAAQDVLRRFLIPPLLAAERLTAARVGPLLAPIKGHRMAKARAGDGGAGRRDSANMVNPSADHLGAVRRSCAQRGLGRGSWTPSPNCSTPSTATSTQGYVRIKLKIEPGWDVEPVRAVRERFGDDVLLQVDANTAYTLARRAVCSPGSTRSTCC